MSMTTPQGFLRVSTCFFWSALIAIHLCKTNWNTAKPWTIWTWDARVHLFIFLNSKFYRSTWPDQWLGTSADTEEPGYRGLTISYMYGQCRGWMLLTPTLFKGQLYLDIEQYVTILLNGKIVFLQYSFYTQDWRNHSICCLLNLVDRCHCVKDIHFNWHHS